MDESRTIYKWCKENVCQRRMGLRCANLRGQRLLKSVVRADIVSWSVLQVLTGQIPFVEYHDNNALLMALVKGTLSLPQFPSYLAADDRSEPALNIAKRCWALDSQQRPGMEIVHEALSSHLGAQSPNNEPRFQSAPAVKPEANEVSGDLPTRTTDIHESTEAPLIPSAEVHPLTHPPSGSRMTPSYHRLRTALRTVSQVYPALPMSFVQNAATTGIEALSVLSTVCLSNCALQPDIES